jgi:hypothetical protein
MGGRSVTKKAIRAKLEQFGEFATRIDREWNRAYGRGDFDSLSRRELNLSARPLVVVDVVWYAGQSVGLSKKTTASLKSIDYVTNGHMEVESLGRGKRGLNRARQSQLAFLAELIETAD